MKGGGADTRRIPSCTEERTIARRAVLCAKGGENLLGPQHREESCRYRTALYVGERGGSI